MRAIISRRVAPAQTLPDHEDDAAHDPPIIDPRDTVREWKIRINPAHLRLAQQPDIRHQQHLLGAAVESDYRPKGNPINAS